MKGKKKEDFDCHNFEQQAIKAMYEGKSLEQALGPLLKTLAAWRYKWQKLLKNGIFILLLQ